MEAEIQNHIKFLNNNKIKNPELTNLYERYILLLGGILKKREHQSAEQLENKKLRTAIDPKNNKSKLASDVNIKNLNLKSSISREASERLVALANLKVKDCDTVEPLSLRFVKSETQRRDFELPDMPLVSIITVVFNAENTISSCIDSVLNQTYQQFEHVIVDGRSTDDTLTLINKKTHSKLTLISNKDRGIYHAMNIGLAKTKGDLIAILNSDDTWDADFLRESVDLIKKSPESIVYCDCVTNNGRMNAADVSEGVLLSQMNIKHNTFLAHRDTYKKVGGFDAYRKINSDARWIRTAYLMNVAFVHNDRALVNYSTSGRSESKSQSERENLLQESASLYTLVFPFLTNEEARILYDANFNCHGAESLIALRQRYREFELFQKSLREFVIFNIKEKEGYEVNLTDPNRLWRLVAICRCFGIDPSELRVNSREGWVRELIRCLSYVGQQKRYKQKKTIVHFVRNFSAPSETFIYDSVQHLNKNFVDELHVVVCDQRQLESDRPYPYVLTLPWDNLNSKTRDQLFEEILYFLEPEHFVSHFALNAFWFWKRLSLNFRNFDHIIICHGIDVFSIGDNKEYTEFMRVYASEATNITLLSVSSYLTKVMRKKGINKNTIHHLPNFYEANKLIRKQSNFWNGERPLKILTIGRLIDWKGQDLLLKAMGNLSTDVLKDFSITFVAGGVCDNKAKLQALAQKLGILDRVEFIDYVDFTKNKTFFSNFDLYVQPSRYSSELEWQTETFGVSVLEAIQAGLPVIVSDAGGLPETVEGRDASRFAAVFRTDDPQHLASLIETFVASPNYHFSDNANYAKNVMERYSQSVRTRLWKEYVSKPQQHKGTVYHVCALGKGGAAGATLNIHRALLRAGWKSFFVTRAQEASRMSQYLPNLIFIQPDSSFDYQNLEVRVKAGLTTFSIDDYAVSNWRLLKLFEPGAFINLAWPAKFFSVFNVNFLARQGFSLYYTVRDMFPITGGCHYFHGCGNWKLGCEPCPQLIDNDDNYPAVVFEYKSKILKPLGIPYVAISDHVVKLLHESPLVSKEAVTRLENMIDVSVFNLSESNSSGEVRNSKQPFKLGYLPSFGSSVKGARELRDALRNLRILRPDFNFELVLLADSIGIFEGEDYLVTQKAPINNKLDLATFYRSMDLILVPSSEETFSNTAVESLACGTPVVGFKTGILPTLQNICPDGCLLSDIGDSTGLALQVAVLAGKEGLNRDLISRTIQARFCESRVVKAYEEFYLSFPQRGKTFFESADHELEARLWDRMLKRKAAGARHRLVNLRNRLTGEKR